VSGITSNHQSHQGLISQAVREQAPREAVSAAGFLAFKIVKDSFDSGIAGAYQLCYMKEQAPKEAVSAANFFQFRLL
jgi:hypothetical protein